MSVNVPFPVRCVTGNASNCSLLQSRGGVVQAHLRRTLDWCCRYLLVPGGTAVLVVLHKSASGEDLLRAYTHAWQVRQGSAQLSECVPADLPQQG